MERNKYYIFRECGSVALVIQHAKHILHGILLHEACLSLHCHINSMKNLLSTRCVFWSALQICLKQLWF